MKTIEDVQEFVDGIPPLGSSDKTAASICEALCESLAITSHRKAPDPPKQDKVKAPSEKRPKRSMV